MGHKKTASEIHQVRFEDYVICAFCINRIFPMMKIEPVFF